MILLFSFLILYRSYPSLFCFNNQYFFTWHKWMASWFHLFFCAEAVADANRAIELDPSLSKAYLRKGLVQCSCCISITYSQLCCVSCSFQRAFKFRRVFPIFLLICKSSKWRYELMMHSIMIYRVLCQFGLICKYRSYSLLKLYMSWADSISQSC